MAEQNKANSVVLIPANPEAEADLVKQLTAAGLDVIVCDNHQKAFRLEATRPKNWKPFLILVDVFLSGVSSFDLVRRFADKYPNKEVPILMLSPYDAAEDRVEATGAGALGLVKKPANYQKINEIIEAHRAKQAATAAIVQTL